jgi:hypothetical protein
MFATSYSKSGVAHFYCDIPGISVLIFLNTLEKNSKLAIFTTKANIYARKNE